MSFDTISSGKIRADSGNSFSAIEIDGDGVLIRNAADETNSSGELVLAGSEEVLSSNRVSGTTINASYIKTGVLDANLMRAGLIQTVPSWNTKWYGAPEDHAAVQMGFTGGSIAATAVSTGTGTVSLTLPGGHGLITGDYVRVSGLYFTTGTLLGGVGLNLPTNGPLDYASATVATNTLTYSKADITSGLTASTASTVYVGKAHTITAVVRSFDNPDNPAELSTVVVTTSAAHGLSVGNYVELVNVAPTIDGVAYISAVTSTTFTFKQRFGDDVNLDLSASEFDLPSLLAPVAIKVLKSYTQNADGSIHITSGTVDSTLIVGEISATEITIGSGGDVVRVGNYPDAITPTFQGIWAGSANPSTAKFSVNTLGALSATSGTIGGYTLASDRLTNVSTTGLIRYAGLIDTAADDGLAFFAGATSTAGAEAKFSATNAGAVTAANLTVTGGSIDFGDFRLSTDGQITKDLVLSQKFIKNENGVELISTESDGGSAYALGPGLNRAIETGIINGDFGSIPPTVGSNLNNSTNRLPYFTTEVSHNDATAPYVQAVADATAASGHVLRFTIPSGAAVGRYARIVRYVAVPGSAARTWTNQPRAAWRNATGTTKTQAVVTVRTQYYQNDGTTTTGTQGTNVSKTFADVFASTYAYETQANPNGTGAIPTDGAYLKIEVGVQVSVETTSAMTVDLTEVRYDRGLIQLLLADQVDPSAYGYGVIYLNNGTMWIRANELGGGNNPTIYLSASTGNIIIDPVGSGTAQILGSTSITGNGSISGELGVLGDINIGVSDTSVDGAIVFKGGNGGSIRAFSASAGNDSLAIKSTNGSAYAPLVADSFFPGGQGSFRLDHDGNFDLNDSLDVTGNITATGNISATGSVSGSTLSTSGNVATNGAGLFHDTPTGVTLASGSTVGRTALWTLNAGTQYNLQRWTSTSTAALKKNIRDTDLSAEQVYNLSLVDFEYDLEKFAELYPHINVEATGTQRGVIWEQVTEVMPEAAVQGYGPGDPPTIDWEALYFGALVAIQDLNRRLTELESR
jgi:hypothetical protein